MSTGKYSRQFFLHRECFTTSFLKKYIHIARQLRPQLSKEAATIISEKYCDLRMQQDVENSSLRRTQPVTARTLETLIRLATANAKARMSKAVTKIDAEAAVELVSFVLFKVKMAFNLPVMVYQTIVSHLCVFSVVIFDLGGGFECLLKPNCTFFRRYWKSRAESDLLPLPVDLDRIRVPKRKVTARYVGRVKG